MAESKYGRLFTEREVRGLIVSAAADALVAAGRDPHVPGVAPDEFATRLIEEMAAPTFPADEPLFLLRGQDRTAADNVEGYANLCQHICSPEHVQAARDAAAAMRRFRAEHPDRVKVPT